MDKGTRTCRAFAADILADILSRLSPNTRRRLRLVCRHWRHVVDKRTATDLRSRAKTLVVTRDTAYVFDDLSTARPSRELLDRDTAALYKDMSVVGTCNGLICLCDNHGGAITLVNPVIGETLSIPPLPPPYVDGPSNNRHQTYCFTYHPATGRYRIVHVPGYVDRVLVFTLGEASWRDVTTGGQPRAKCDLDAGIVSAADGKVYFALEGREARIMAFDLDDENLTPIKPLPDILSRLGSWVLREVHGRLAIAFTHVSQTLIKTEVWVMVGGTKWNCWYILELHKQRHQELIPWHLRQRLAFPHFSHGSKYVLTRNISDSLYVHTLSDDTRKAQHGVVRVSETNQGTRPGP
ncbi:unnamed protein product [Alopecurus aequalis]